MKTPLRSLLTLLACSLALCAADARKPGVAVVHDMAPDNTCYVWAIGDKAVCDAAFAKAAHVTKLDLVNNRLIPNAMEPRASIGEFNPGTGDYKLTTTSQNPHLTRLLVAAFVLGIEPLALRRQNFYREREAASEASGGDIWARMKGEGA